MNDWTEIDWSKATAGIEAAAYPDWKAAEPQPLTLETLQRAFDALERQPPRRDVELHHSGCAMWRTLKRLDCSCSPGWMSVPVNDL